MHNKTQAAARLMECIIKTQAAAKLLECGDEGVLEADVLYSSPLFRDILLQQERSQGLAQLTFLLLISYPEKAAMHKEHMPREFLHRRTPKASLRLDSLKAMHRA